MIGDPKRRRVGEEYFSKYSVKSFEALKRLAQIIFHQIGVAAGKQRLAFVALQSEEGRAA